MADSLESLLHPENLKLASRSCADTKFEVVVTEKTKEMILNAATDNFFLIMFLKFPMNTGGIPRKHFLDSKIVGSKTPSEVKSTERYGFKVEALENREPKGKSIMASCFSQ